MARPTVRIFPASSSGIAMSTSSSNAITISTVSRESAPKSSTKEASGTTSSSSAPSCWAMIFLIRSSTAIGFFTSSPITHLPLLKERRTTGLSSPLVCFPSPHPARHHDHSDHQHAAVHVQHMPRDVAGLVRGQEADRLRHIRGLAQSAQRDLLLQRLFHLCRQPLRHGCVDEARRHRVHGRSEERRVGKECRSRWSPY